MTYYFIANPAAGFGIGFDFFSALQQQFQSSIHDMTLHFTTSPNDATTIARTLANQPHEDLMVVCCGGDGTLQEVVNGLAGTDIPLLVLPMGTGNDFAKKIYGKGFELQALIERLQLHATKPNFHLQPIDLVKLNERYFINIMSFGFDTMVQGVGKAMAERCPFLRKICYDLAVISCLFKDKKFTLEMDLQYTDGRRKKQVQSFTLSAICNGSYYGGGFCPAPDADLTDSSLEFCLVEPLNLFQIARIAPSYKKGLIQHPRVHYDKVKSGRIRTLDGSPLPINFDGEVMNTNCIDFEVQPNMLSLALLDESLD